VEHLITIAKRGVAEGANGRVLQARRLVMHDLQDRDVVTKLFDTLAPRFQARPGGYTRLLRLGFRKGDAAEIAQVELVGSEFDPRAKAEAGSKKTEAAPARTRGVGGRLRAAADRLRGKKDAPAATEEKPIVTKAAGAAKPRPKKQGPRGS